MKIKKLLLALVGAAASIAASAASPSRVVFIGDSITAQSVWGYGYCTAMKPLMPDTTLVSLGWSGQTLDGWKNAEIDNRGGSGDYGTELETGFRIGTELDSQPAEGADISSAGYFEAVEASYKFDVLPGVVDLATVTAAEVDAITGAMFE